MEGCMSTETKYTLCVLYSMVIHMFLLHVIQSSFVFLLLAPFSTILSLCMSMITLLDVLSLPSCGFSSKERYLRPEILRCYAHLSNCEPNMIDQNSFNTIMETLFEKIIRRKMNKEKFLQYEKKWLESQQLQLVRILIFLLFKLQLY